MKIGLYFLCVLLLGLFFELAEPIEKAFFPGQRNFLLLVEYPMYFRSFVYYICEHLTYILLALIVFFEVPEAKLYAGTFMILEFLDGIDFWVTGNGTWATIDGWPITFNVIKVSLFVLVITNKLTWILFKRLKIQE